MPLVTMANIEAEAVNIQRTKAPRRHTGQTVLFPLHNDEHRKSRASDAAC